MYGTYPLINYPAKTVNTGLAITQNKYCQLKNKFSLTLSPESMNEYKTDINTLCDKLLSD